MSEANFARNPVQRTPCILILDHSQSMGAIGDTKRSRIDDLNDGISAFVKSLQQDALALSRVQIAIVSCAGDKAELMLDWTDAAEFEPFELSARGGTPLGEALMLSLDAIKSQKIALREYRIPYTRPWIFILTDGEPTDSDSTWQTACQAAREAEQHGSVEIFCVGIGGADMKKLADVSRRAPLQLNGLHFREMFVWLSASLSQMSRSSPDTKFDLPSTGGWSSVRL